MGVSVMCGAYNEASGADGVRMLLSADGADEEEKTDEEAMLCNHNGCGCCLS